MTLFPRSSGILLHPTSLPGAHGIGDLGEWAYRFADWLAERGQSVWQILPLGPTSYGDSPYQTLSTFAGNPNLIDLDALVGKGWLDASDLADAPDFPAHTVDYGPVIAYHDDRLALAARRFNGRATGEQRAAYEGWAAENAAWLDDYALFVALKASHGGRPWVEWPEGEALRKPAALDAAREALREEIDTHRFQQWLFATQWDALHTYAAELGIRLMGDIPIFVAHDSADVWANREMFYLDEAGSPTAVAGVPPDYFSETGQRWGNPLYRWDVLKENDYAWWVARFRATLEQVDLVRIDHFRGFDAYWEIPAEEETAVNGEWVPGPGADLFEVVKAQLGELPIVAEDLGVITESVEALRDDFGLPGMKVLQFAWSDPKNPFLPHNHDVNSVVYTGTHDNNTTVGWWNGEIGDDTRHFLSEYLNQPVHEANWTLIQVGMRSAAHTFITPLQDVLGLGSDARMNTPGNPMGNWTWRFTPEMLDYDAGERLAHLTWLYQRRPDQQTREYGDVAVKK